MTATAAPCTGCDPTMPAGTYYHLRDCPYWESLPPLVTRLSDVGLAPIAEEKIDPREIVARVFEHPFKLEAHVEIAAMAPPAGSTKGKNIPIGQYGIAVANRCTPEMLLAIVANLIAQSTSAAEAVHAIRVEVSGWTFEDSHGVKT